MIMVNDYVRDLKEHMMKQIIRLKLRAPKLAVSQIGNNPATDSYVKGKKKDFEDIGGEVVHCQVSEGDIERTRNLVFEFNKDDTVSGIIVQLPLEGVDKWDEDDIIDLIAPEKDVDGFLKNSPYIPCTAKGVIAYLSVNNFIGWNSVITIVGRGRTAGKGLIDFFRNEPCTLLLANSSTDPATLRQMFRMSDYIFLADGRVSNYTLPDFVRPTEQNLYDLPTVLVDITLGKDKDNRLCGSIKYDDAEYIRKQNNPDKLFVSGKGGVGLLTRVSLLENCIISEIRKKKEGKY